MGILDKQKGDTPSGVACFYNNCLVCNGAKTTNAHIGGSGTWTAPQGAKEITFHIWSGGGAGAGTCCHSCLCTKTSIPGQGGYYAKKTIRRCDGCFLPGDTYSYCYGEGGNGSYNSGCGCETLCCLGPRGCKSYVTGPGLSNFCITGACGGWGRWCTGSTYKYSDWRPDLAAEGIVVGDNVDEAHYSMGSLPNYAKDNYDHGSFTQTTPQSYGLMNSHSYWIECGMRSCGWADCKKGTHQIAMGGLSVMKAQCNGYICACCKGSPGNPGMVKIEWR